MTRETGGLCKCSLACLARGGCVASASPGDAGEARRLSDRPPPPLRGQGACVASCTAGSPPRPQTRERESKVKNNQKPSGFSAQAAALRRFTREESPWKGSEAVFYWGRGSHCAPVPCAMQACVR